MTALRMGWMAIRLHRQVTLRRALFFKSHFEWACHQIAQNGHIADDGQNDGATQDGE
jgi:hypothetical protein